MQGKTECCTVYGETAEMQDNILHEWAEGVGAPSMFGAGKLPACAHSLNNSHKQYRNQLVPAMGGTCCFTQLCANRMEITAAALLCNQ